MTHSLSCSHIIFLNKSCIDLYEDIPTDNLKICNMIERKISIENYTILSNIFF